MFDQGHEADEEIMNQPAVCRICGQSAQYVRINRIINHYELFLCFQCKTVLIDQPPSPHELEAIYNQLFSSGEYEPHRLEFNLIRSGKMPPMRSRSAYMKRVEKICSGRKLVEVGGGTGGFGILAKKRGWEYSDYDISPVAVEFAKKLSLDAHVFEIGQIPPIGEKTADLVVMWEVIEHVWDVAGYLDAIHKALKPGGVFLMSTPNYYRESYRKSYWGPGGSPPVHMNFFTPESLRIVLQKYFDPIEIIQKRLYLPVFSSLKSWISSAKRLLHLEASPSLIGIARK